MLNISSKGLSTGLAFIPSNDVLNEGCNVAKQPFPMTEFLAMVTKEVSSLTLYTGSSDIPAQPQRTGEVQVNYLSRVPRTEVIK